MIDNYDSFVYNLVQYLAQIGAEVEVWRNDDPRFADRAFHDGYDGVLLSPGPGTPEEAGVCIDVVERTAGSCRSSASAWACSRSAVAYGGVVDRAPELLHGKTSEVFHDGSGVLAGLPSPVHRHSLPLAGHRPGHACRTSSR